MDGRQSQLSRLIMLVKRGNSYIVPNGQVALIPGDVLLTISETNRSDCPGEFTIEKDGK